MVGAANKVMIKGTEIMVSLASLVSREGKEALNSLSQGKGNGEGLLKMAKSFIPSL